MMHALWDYLRSIVMLVSLVVIPALALWGAQLPKPIRSWLFAGQQKVPAAATTSGQPDADTIQGDTPHITDIDSRPQDTAPRPRRYQSEISAPSQMDVVNDSVDSTLPEGDHRAPSRKRELAGELWGTLQATERQQQLAATEGDESPPDQDHGSQDPLAHASRRLRKLGATNFQLESWGNEGQLFRFHCRVPLADQKRIARHFEATRPQPGEAVNEVIRQIEAWRQNRRNPEIVGQRPTAVSRR